MARFHLILSALLIAAAATAPALAAVAGTAAKNTPLPTPAKNSPSSSSSSSSAKNGKDGKGNDKHCPDADSCNLATQGDLDDVVRFFGGRFTGSVGAFLSEDTTQCERLDVSAGVPPPECAAHPGELVPAIGVAAKCPQGGGDGSGPFASASVSCAGFVLGAGDKVLSSAPISSLVVDDDRGPSATCKVSAPVPSLPAGARLYAQMTFYCTQDLSLFVGDGSKAAAAGNEKTNKAPAAQVTKAPDGARGVGGALKKIPAV